MTEEPTYSIWKGQHDTQSYLQRYAERLFENMSPKLNPHVFLLGLLREQKNSCPPACTEPENCGVNVELLGDVYTLAKSIWENDPRRMNFVSDQPTRDNYQLDVKRDSVRSAVQQLIYQNLENKNTASFVSRAGNIEDFEVFVVLQLDEHIYNSFYNLRPREPAIWPLYDSSHNLHPREPIPPSFLNSLIHVFLDDALLTLYRPYAPSALQLINSDMSEVMRIAATHFVGSTISTVRNPNFFPPDTYTNLQEFFSIFDNISALNYEGDASTGKIVMCDKNHPNFDIHLELATPVSLHSYKKVRKLLETAARDLVLWSEGHRILGLGKQHGDYDESSQSLLSVHFRGSRKWEMIHGPHTLLVVEYGVPSLPRLKINRETFHDLLQRTFDTATPDNLSKMCEIVDAATSQKHGALLIISSDAEGEAERLNNQSTKIKPTELNESLIRNVTSIDGATLLDVTSTCYSIGVILDGIATPKGTSERGARYNSAIRYVENNYGKCVAVIISEDGMVDLYPDLKPRIRQSEITKQLETLRSISTVDVLDDDKYRIAMNWLRKHGFYLSLEQCDEINQLKRACEKKPRTDPFAIHIVYPDLKPSPEMNESYFLDE